MSEDLSKFVLLELTVLLIDINKQFTIALKAKRPYAELVEIYSQIREIHNHIINLKEQGKIAV
jgi:hypothetical protein